MSFKTNRHRRNLKCHIGGLRSDLDVMYCSVEDKACFSDQGNILVEPLIAAETGGFTGYANLSSLTPGFEGRCVTSKLIRSQAEQSVENVGVSNIPDVPNGVDPRKYLQRFLEGPAMKIKWHGFEVDITFCIYCPEWPSLSDWSSRQRYWPSLVDAQRIMSLGCHFVAKPAPYDKEKTSWRFSFSLAEIELSKLVPDTARKCFLAMKIILKDHLQPIEPWIRSYHIKTVFLNTLEKLPVGFWVEENIEECFMTLLTELRDCLVDMKCPHHWFSFINLFEWSIPMSSLEPLARKVERIICDPAPFIFDDGCCCLSPCCLRVPSNNFTRRSIQELHADYEEVTITVDADMIRQEQNPVTRPFQLPVSATPTQGARDDPCSHPSEEECQASTAMPGQLVVSLPPTSYTERESRLFSDEQEEMPLIVCLPPEQDPKVL